MINLLKHKDAERLFRNAANPEITEPGTFFLYAEGDYSSQVNSTPLGKIAWELHEKDRVWLFQKKISNEPRVYAYWAVVK